jgi:hypothetical protein
MSEASILKTRSSQIGKCTLAATILMFGCAALAGAQDQQGGSLADAARQARAQKQANGDTSQAQQMANELSEDQNEKDAPSGFKTYNAGDYKLWVPAPYKVEGHEDAGVVLSGPNAGVKRAVLLVGTPIAVHGENADADLQETAANFSKSYARSATCTKTSVGDLPAYECGLTTANLLNAKVSGRALFLLGAGNVYPVLCTTGSVSVAPDAASDGQKSPDHEIEDSKNVAKSCETVFQSIRLKTGADASQTQTASVAGSSSPSSNAVAASAAPAGFKVQAFNYCRAHHDCWNASVLVPADAKLVSSACKQFAFESKVQGTSVLLMAGPAIPDCDGTGAGGGAGLVRWNELVDPENKRAPGTYTLVGSQSTTIDDRPAAIITISFRKGLDSWMGRRAELESNGVPLVVGCIAPKDHFEDGEAMCSKLIESLQLP